MVYKSHDMAVVTQTVGRRRKSLDRVTITIISRLLRNRSFHLVQNNKSRNQLLLLFQKLSISCI